MHHFFRVYASDERQLDNLHHIANNFNPKALSSIYDSVSSKNLIINKNMAISLSLLLMTGISENLETLSNACIDLWHTILNDEKYLNDYKRIFFLDDEVGIDESLLDNLKDSIIKELTRVYSDIAKLYNNNYILGYFINKFQLNNSTLHLDQVEEIYNNIHKAIKTMGSMNISEDGVFDEDEKRILNECLKVFREKFDELIDLGLYDNEQTMMLRDLVATKIRIQTLDLWNNLSESETTLELIRFALYVAGTSALKNKLSDELNTVESNISFTAYIKPLMDLVENLEKKSGYMGIYEMEAISAKIQKFCQELNLDKTMSQLEKDRIMDAVAVKLRSISVDLHNKSEKFRESQLLLQLALEIAKSQEIKEQCSKDLRVVNETVAQRCGINGFLNSTFGNFLTRIIGYGIIFLILGGISSCLR